MGMLTAEFPPSGGDATLAGFSVSNEPEKTRRRVGYCPQFDAHFQNMTGREHVELYASIKGVPREHVSEAAAQKLREVGLSESDCNRLSSGYSGGMKRKLSVACATIGNPQMVSFHKLGLILLCFMQGSDRNLLQHFRSSLTSLVLVWIR